MMIYIKTLLVGIFCQKPYQTAKTAPEIMRNIKSWKVFIMYKPKGLPSQRTAPMFFATLKPIPIQSPTTAPCSIVPASE